MLFDQFKQYARNMRKITRLQITYDLYVDYLLFSPGQDASVHGTDSVWKFLLIGTPPSVLTKHFFPSPVAMGLLQNRVRDRMPSPQLTEHAP